MEKIHKDYYTTIYKGIVIDIFHNENNWRVQFENENLISDIIMHNYFKNHKTKIDAFKWASHCIEQYLIRKNN